MKRENCSECMAPRRLAVACSPPSAAPCSFETSPAISCRRDCCLTPELNNKCCSLLAVGKQAAGTKVEQNGEMQSGSLHTGLPRAEIPLSANYLHQKRTAPGNPPADPAELRSDPPNHCGCCALHMQVEILTAPRPSCRPPLCCWAV